MSKATSIGAPKYRLRGSLSAASVAILATIYAPVAAAQDTINALVWCDQADPTLIEPFEAAHNVKVNLKEYEGTGTALSLVEQSQPGDWDVFVLDGIDVPRVVEAGLLAPLPTDKLPTADLFPELVMEKQNTKDGKTYAISEKFGYNTISYNKSKVDPAKMADMSVIWSDTYKLWAKPTFFPASLRTAMMRCWSWIHRSVAMVFPPVRFAAVRRCRERQLICVSGPNISTRKKRKTTHWTSASEQFGTCHFSAVITAAT